MSNQIVPADQVLPAKVLVLPLTGRPLFPGIFTPFMLSDAEDIKVAEGALEGNNFLGVMDVQLASSRDGWHWNRVADRATFLGVGPEAWDRWFVHAGSLLVADDTVHVYYHGWPVKHGHGRRDKGRTPNPEAPRPQGGGIGLATLPADRFVGLRAASGDRNAWVQTVPLTWQGDDLLVNASGDGLRVELLDMAGIPLPGHDAAACRLEPADSLRWRVRWSGHSLPAGPGSEPRALRFYLHDSELFAFQVV